MFSFFGKIKDFLGAEKRKERKEPEVKREIEKEVVEEAPKPVYRPVEKKAKKQPPVFSAEAALVLERARAESQRLVSEAHNEAARVRREVEELRARTVVVEAEVARKAGALEEREKIIKNRLIELDQKALESEKIKEQQVAKLEKIAGLTREEARQLVIEATEKKLAEEVSRRIREAEESVKISADKAAKDILTETMVKGATDYVAEYTVSTIRLEDEEMKGRIIGREGRNIRTFEQAAGVEIELDETNDIRISSFDPIRREVARRTLDKLIKDRRIQPSRIEDVLAKTKEEMEKILFEEGEKLCHQVKIYRLHPDLVKTLGRFKFRFSHGQNMIIHTLEVVKIAVAVANEVGADVNVVRLGALLHDIGKVVTEEEGTHVQLGMELVKRYRLPNEVVACIAEHHEDIPFSSAESRIVWIADAISGARPGARYEPHEEYVERMKQIEEIASSFKGVSEAYAYQAGRDVRVLVKPEEVADSELAVLAYKIKEELEKKANYAGQIKVTCIRELRASEVTKAK